MCLKMDFQGIPLRREGQGKKYVFSILSLPPSPPPPTPFCVCLSSVSIPSIHDIPKWCDSRELWGKAGNALPPRVLYNYLLLFCVVSIRTCTQQTMVEKSIRNKTFNCDYGSLCFSEYLLQSLQPHDSFVQRVCSSLLVSTTFLLLSISQPKLP